MSKYPTPQEVETFVKDFMKQRGINHKTDLTRVRLDAFRYSEKLRGFIQVISDKDLVESIKIHTRE